MYVVRNASDKPPEDVPGEPGDTSDDNAHASNELIFELRERARFAERQLEETNEANRENRHIIDTLIQKSFEANSAGGAIEVSERASERPEGEVVPTVSEDAESSQDSSQDTSVYQPRRGFLPELRDTLPWQEYVVSVVVPTFLGLPMFADLPLPDFMWFLPFVAFFFTWTLFAFFIGLRKRKFPWAACFFTGYLGSLAYGFLDSAGDDLLEAVVTGDLFTDFIGFLRYVLDIGMLYAGNGYFSFFLAGVLLGKAVQRRGLNMGLYASEETPQDERQAAKELSPRTLAILGFAAPIIANVITASATLFSN